MSDVLKSICVTVSVMMSAAGNTAVGYYVSNWDRHRGVSRT